MNDFKKRLTILISVNAVIIFILGAGIILLGFDISNWSNRIAELRGQMDFWAEATGNLASLRSDYEQAKIYSADLDNIFPARDQLLNFSKDLNIIANQNKVNLSASLGSEEVQPNTNLSRVNFAIAAEGTFDNLINLLKAVKNSRYFIKLNGIDLVRQQKAEPRSERSSGIGDNFRAQINGQVFSFQK